MTLHILQALPSPHHDGRQGWHVIIGWNLKGKPDYVGGYGWGIDGVEAAARAYGDAADTLARRKMHANSTSVIVQNPVTIQRKPNLFTHP